MLSEPVCKYVRGKIKEEYRVKYALHHRERRDLVAEVGVHGLVLFEYYLRMASIEDVEVTDQDIADYFGWNTHTARRYRRLLVKEGWLKVSKGSLANGRKIIVYYLGKEEVALAQTIQSGMVDEDDEVEVS